jgi:translation elongation factor EF-1alpha
MDVIRWNLRGVGELEEKHIQEGDVAIHYRRPMTEDEISKIDLSKRVVM